MKPITFLVAAVLASLLESAPARAATPPTFYIDNATANENEGVVCFQIRKAGTKSTSPSTVLLTTIAGSAKALTDYAPQTFKVWLGPIETTFRACVPLTNDAIPEGTETFTVKITKDFNSRLGDGTAIGTILDTDAPAPPQPPAPPPPPVFTVQDVSGIEGAGPIHVIVAKSGTNGLPSQVRYMAMPGHGTATTDVDYQSFSAVITVPADAAGFTFDIPIVNDALVEGDETLMASLQSVSNATIARDAMVTIIDDDKPVAPGTVQAKSACASSFGRTPAAGERFTLIPNSDGYSAGWPEPMARIVAVQPLDGSANFYVWRDCLAPVAP